MVPDKKILIHLKKSDLWDILLYMMIVMEEIYGTYLPIDK